MLGCIVPLGAGGGSAVPCSASSVNRVSVGRLCVGLFPASKLNLCPDPEAERSPESASPRARRPLVPRPRPIGTRATRDRVQFVCQTSKLNSLYLQTERYCLPRALVSVFFCVVCCAPQKRVGKRCFLTMAEARQPKSSMGAGHLDVTSHMRATWLKPLLASAGADPATRPYKNFYAQLVRRAYPEMEAGAELLTLNLSFHAILDLPAEAVLGETRQAFRALAALPPFRYSPPSGDSPAQPREDMARAELLDQVLHHNPMLDRKPAVSRTTPRDEEDMRHWAAHGLRRVRDILDSSATALLAFEALLQAHPGLHTTAHPRGRLRRMYAAFAKNLAPWAETIAAGPPALTDGEFRSTTDGKG